MWVGVTTAAPDTLTLPSCVCGWECAVVMNSDCVDECGIRVSTDSQQRLWIHMSNMQLCLISPVGLSVCLSGLLFLLRNILL